MSLAGYTFTSAQNAISGDQFPTLNQLSQLHYAYGYQSLDVTVPANYLVFDQVIAPSLPPGVIQRVSITNQNISLTPGNYKIDTVLKV